ncbi:HEAT repeat domain-containing protein [Pseudomonas sp. NPDC089406]|uniref:HEAT repeat domain-containing protein n=1 Tax=Pseudomonas sp. NPDC089406 TaxID=3364463 RepID=UPI00384E082B
MDLEPELILGHLDSLPEGPGSVATLTRLLLDERHERHEDIVFTLGLAGDPAAVPAIATAMTIPFASLVRWDNLHEFQRKCAYALARIGTEQSREALQQLLSSHDPHIRQYAEEGLSRWPLK